MAQHHLPEQQAGASSYDSLVASVLALPPALASRIAATAEALSLLSPYTQFPVPVDCRLVAQAVHRASRLGRVQRETACGAPLCVLVDMAALQRRPGALAACLCWLLRLPNLRAATVRFAGDGARSMVGGYELSLLLQLAAAHPQAAGSLRHIAVCAGGLGWYFDAGGLAPLTHLLSLGLVWYCAADLSQLPPSVRSVEMRLPGVSFQHAWLRSAQAAGVPEVDAHEQLAQLYQPLGLLNPLADVPSHHLKELIIDADGLSLHLSASQLFGAAEAVQLRGAGVLQLLLPLPGRSGPWEQLVQWIQEAGGLAATPTLRAQQFAFALLEAFRLSGLHSAQLCAHRWALQLPILMDGSAAPAVAAAARGEPDGVELGLSSEVMLDAVNMAVNGALGQFGRLRATESKLVNGQLQLSLRRSSGSPAAIRTCGLLGGALRNLACAVCVLAALSSLTALARHINPQLGRTLQAGATGALSALSLALVDQDFLKQLLHHT